MQTEKSHPSGQCIMPETWSQLKGKRIMPETSFTKFPALCIDQRDGISRSASETDVRLFFLPMTLKIIFDHHFFYLKHFMSHNNLFGTPFGVFGGGAKVTLLLKFTVLTPLLMSHVSCPCPWARQNFPAPLKIEQTLSHR